VLVGLGHVDGHRRVTALEGRPLVAGHPCALVEECDSLGTEAHVELLPHEALGHGIIVPVPLHVVVDVHAGEFPLGIRIGLGGQWSECGPVKGLEHALA